MKLSQRIRIAYKSFTTDELGTSKSFGSVLRNYSKQASFRPQEQLQGITYKAIDKIGLELSVYEPYIKKADGSTFENHPMLNLYNQPNPEQTASDFIHLYGMLFEIYGETFWYLVRGETSNKVKEVYLLNPSMIELKYDGGELLGYILHKSDGSQVPFTPEEIIHDKRPNPFNPKRGMSVMERASVYIDTEITTSVFTLNYMKNNASPSGIVSLPNMDKNTFNQFAAQWREGYEGPENAGKTAFIRGGEADFKAVGATLKDVDQKITREMAKGDVLMMLEVPKEILGVSQDSGFGRNTVEAFRYVFATGKLEPMMTRLDRIYEKILGMNGLNDLATGIEHESCIPEDKTHQLERQTKGTNIWITVNEARAIDGLPPIDGGDELQPKNVAPIAPIAGKSATKVVLKKALTRVEADAKLKITNEAYRKHIIATSDTYAMKYKKEMGKHLNRQRDSIVASLKGSTKAFEEWLFSVKEETVKMTEDLAPIIIALMEDQSQDVANWISGELMVISPEARRSVEAEILKITGVFNSETITALEKSLGEGVKDGESLVKLKARVEQQFSDAKGYRAERIARTESLRASNATAEEVYKQNGFSSVEWFINPGACEFCETYAAQTKAIGRTFTNIGDVVTGTNGGQMRIEYADIDTPPLHPNCTCSLIPSS